MSGGSYDYLYSRDASDFLGDQSTAMENLDRMADRLAGLGFADAAQESRRLYLEVLRCQARIRPMIDRLEDVWHAIEWVDSGDYSMRQLNNTIATYRGEEQEAQP